MGKEKNDYSYSKWESAKFPRPLFFSKFFKLSVRVLGVAAQKLKFYIKDIFSKCDIC